MGRSPRRCALRALPALALFAAIACGSSGKPTPSATANPDVTALEAAGHAPVRPGNAHEQQQPRPQVGTSAPQASAPAATVAAASSPEVLQVGARPLTLDPAALQSALASVPVLSGLAAGFTAFSERDIDAALRKGGRGRDSIQVYTFPPSAFAWSPTKDKTFWVLSGRSGARVLIAVIVPLAGGTYAHAASTVIEEPNATVAVGHNAEVPNQLLWTTCYGCAGEGGTIRLRDDGRVEFTYR